MCGGDSIDEQQQEQQQDKSENHNVLLNYLDQFLSDEAIAKQKKWGRVDCCGSSRSLYCSQCCRILIPKSDWPDCIRDGTLELPFDLDLVLHDRRKSSSGLQAVTLLQAAATDNNQRRCVRLVDAVCGQELADYKNDGVYLLFPSEGESVSFAEVSDKLKVLVVLDCKWTRSSKKDHPALANLPKVHLSLPTGVKSHFWRWHNAGPGMVSTMEAIYYAAKEVVEYSKDETTTPSNDLIHIMWLFGLQRAFIQQHAKKEGRALPFEDHGKEEQRALRRITEERRQRMKIEARQRNWREKQKQVKAATATVHCSNEELATNVEA